MYNSCLTQVMIIYSDNRRVVSGRNKSFRLGPSPESETLCGNVKTARTSGILLEN